MLGFASFLQYVATIFHQAIKTGSRCESTRIIIKSFLHSETSHEPDTLIPTALKIDDTTPVRFS